MLFALFVGAGNHLYAACSLCIDPIHMGVGEHHECGSCCENHFPDCSNHTSSVEHKCEYQQSSIAEYIPSIESRVSNLFYSILYRVVEQNSSILTAVDISQSWLFALFDEVLFRGYNPSTGALRAPPVLG